MKTNIFIVSLLFAINAASQSTDKEFEDLYKSINSKKTLIANLNKNDSNYLQELSIANETYQLLDYLYEFMNDEHRLNGKGSFSFSGNETKLKNIYRVGAGVSMDQGLYPYELDFSANVQTLLNNGVFEENVSDIDISFDFHPYVPNPDARIKKYEALIDALPSGNITSIEKENADYLRNKYLKKIENAYNANGLWLENYVIAKRYSDNYLGIDERYEIGGGFIFSLYSKSLTNKGRSNHEEINRKPVYKMHQQDLLRCLESCAPVRNVLQLTGNDILTISETRSRYLVANRKQYSKLRLSLLVGAFFELEKNTITNTISFNGIDTTIAVSLAPAHKLKAEFRPGLAWKPKDNYRLRLYPFIKIPLDNIKNVVSDGINRDERTDYAIDLHANLDIKVEKRFSVTIFYRYIYDNAPARIFLQQANNSFVLLEAEKQRSNFGIALNFDF